VVLFGGQTIEDVIADTPCHIISLSETPFNHTVQTRFFEKKLVANSLQLLSDYYSCLR